MAFDRGQQVGKASEHVRTDRFALIGAGHREDAADRDTKMVRPEPDQALDEADVGADGGVEAHLGFTLDELSGQRRLLIAV